MESIRLGWLAHVIVTKTVHKLCTVGVQGVGWVGGSGVVGIQGWVGRSGGDLGGGWVGWWDLGVGG